MPEQQTRKNTGAFIALTATALLLVPWCVHIAHKALNHDVIWFITAASRWLAGQGVVQCCYDPNPPLNFLIYLPVIGLRHLGVAWDNGVILYMLVLLMLAAAAFYALLCRMGLKEGQPLIMALLFVLCGTVMNFADFGQRDQFIAFALAPLITGQLLLTRRHAVPPALLNTVFAVGAMLIWLRPHFGLLPACFLIHRAITQRRLNIWRDPDFIALAAVSILYIFGLWLFFPDFLHVILPDLPRLYLSGGIHGSTGRVLTFIMLFLNGWTVAVLAGLVLTFHPKLRNSERPARSFFVAALFCLFVYAVQLRDFSYHLLPALTFFWLGLGDLMLSRLHRPLPRLILLAALAAMGYMLYPPGSYPTRQQIADLPLTKIVAACGPDCGLSGFGLWPRPMQLIPYYAGKEHSARFSDWWFAPELMRRPVDDRLFRKYAAYVAADLERWPRSLVLVCDKKNIDYFSVDPAFAAAWRDYAAVQTLTFGYAPLYPPHTPDIGQPMACHLYKKA